MLSQLCELNNSVYDEEMVAICEEVELNTMLVDLCMETERDQVYSSGQTGAGVKRKATVLTQSSSKRPCSQEPSTSTGLLTTSTSTEGGSTSFVSPANNHSVECPYCKTNVNQKYYTSHLKSKKHINNVLLNSSIQNLANVQIIENAFGRRIVTYRISNENTSSNSEFETPEYFLNSIKNIIYELLDKLLKEYKAIKVNCILSGEFIQTTKNLENSFDFQTINYILCLEQEINKIYSDLHDEISNKVCNFEKKDSGWSLKKINYIDLNINKFNPLRGSSYIDLPLDIKHKHAVINVKNNDYQCFQWAVLSALYPVNNHVDRILKHF
ncbi:uncharacterized protein [Maniola hyperantus]|uniref:uncharacterized protein n=1 Tax=Aphantopus hyperantus TaxID=2795564 RepID=UPI0037485867